MSDGPEHVDAPILEFDPSPTAVIEPSEHIEPIDIPPHAVLCFFQDVIEKVVAEHGGRIDRPLVSEIGRNPIYELDIDGAALALVHPGVGAPLAAAFLEELIARGGRAFIAVRRRRRAGPRPRARPRDRPDRGDPRRGHQLPLPAARARGRADARGGRRDRRDARRHHVPYVTGKTWTTDGFYRETRGKVDTPRRRGLPHGRDGGRGVLRGRPRSAASRSGSCSTRATISRETRGTTGMGSPRLRPRAAVPPRGRGVPVAPAG